MKKKIFVVCFAVIALMLSLGPANGVSDNPDAGTGGWYCPMEGAIAVLDGVVRWPVSAEGTSRIRASP
jgi:hypothetical protein